MLTTLAVALVYNYQLILAPALVILLFSFLGLGLRFSRVNKAVGLLLIAVGAVELMAGVPIGAFWGFVIGIITLMVGISITAFLKIKEDCYQLSKSTGAVFLALACIMLVLPVVSFSLLSFMAMFFGIAILVALMGVYAASRVNQLIVKQSFRLPFKRWNTPRARKALYVSFIVAIVLCSLLITVRATKLVREEALVTYDVVFFGDQSTLTVRGVVTSVSYNHEVNMGYCYHIFPAYVTVQVTEVVWVTANYANHTEVFTQNDLVVYYENQDTPYLTVGQKVEVNGCYCDWFEDSMYSDKLVVSDVINGSYLNPL